MSENTPNQSKAMQAIDVLLADKPSEFRAVVFELSRQIGWPDDEPGFLLAIATGQLEALIRQYPERITAAMQQAIEELKADWQQILEKLTLLATQNIDAAHQINASLHDGLFQTEQLFADQQTAVTQIFIDGQEAFGQFMAEQRAAMGLTVQQITEQQKQVIEAETTLIISQGVAGWAKRAEQEVQQAIKSVRRKHYWESVPLACIAVTILCSVVWLGSSTSTSRAQAASTWGDIERWNQDTYQACVAAKKTTCNIHIQLPK